MTEPTVLLRDATDGDLDWIVAAHDRFYGERFGWGDDFGREVRRIVRRYRHGGPERGERCWIAELEGAAVGSVMLARDDEETARLRLLYVDAAARGHGLGSRLVGTVVDAAKGLGARSLVLHTTDRQIEARHIYERFGFRLESTGPSMTFDERAVNEHWRLDLTPPESDDGTTDD